MDDILFTSATELARKLRVREVSATEAVAAHLAQIERVNPMLNAVVQFASERAMEEAKTADNTTPTRPLHGVPITAYGTRGRKNFIPDQDATVAKRLRDAGAIILQACTGMTMAFNSFPTC